MHVLCFIAGSWSDLDLYGLAEAIMLPSDGKHHEEIMKNIVQAAHEIGIEGKAVIVSTLGELGKLLGIPNIPYKVIQHLKSLHSMVSGLQS